LRPVTRGDSPRDEEFDPYRDAFGPLVGRLGQYCSYCERRIPTQLAVEHIQPKGLEDYEHLVGTWDNYLLGCVNCNGTKSDKDVKFDSLYFPDRDNTSAAFTYIEDGTIEPSQELTAEQVAIAQKTLELTGLDKEMSNIQDENGAFVHVDRVGQRKETWLIARTSRDDLNDMPTDGLRRQIVRTAQESGYFSIWIEVFKDDYDMKRMLIVGFDDSGTYRGFAGTARDCYDLVTLKAISPRPHNGLEGSGKI